jgi:membrane-associated phospholipid phosphatase
MVWCGSWPLVVLFTVALTSAVRAQNTNTDSAGGSGSGVKPKTFSDFSVPETPKAPPPGYELQPGEDPENRLLVPLVGHLVRDQKHFWTSPIHMQRQDLRWIAPFAGLTGGLIASDSWITKQVPDNPNQLRRSLNISNYSTYSLVGAAGGAFVWGHITKNDHLAETGLLAGEAALNSTAVSYALKAMTQRPRPMEGNGNGTFFRGGNSFPSEHSSVAWSVASVLAHEYPGPLSKFAAYGLASAVTLTRLTSKQHFASDVVIGSALGWYFGRQVYRAHHDPELGGAAWSTFTTASDDGRQRRRNMASPYIPLDNWIYPAFERLAALGYLQSAYMNQRPWTRLECARMIEDAGEQILDSEIPGDQVAKLYRELSLEFAGETERLNGARNLDVALESLYARATGISGTPLRDSFHFGQTIANDYGRPYAEGTNLVFGMSARATAGPLAFYMRGEYQQAPSTPLYSASVLQAIAQADGNPVLPNAAAAVSRLDLLESLVALDIGNIQVSYGKQSAWLGPARSGSLLLSNNARPFTMLRFDTVSPYRIPGVSRLLGPLKNEFFIGQLSGHTLIFDGTKFIGPNIDPQPFVHGDRISFKPTDNLEVGMGIVAMFGGPGLPFTWHNFLRTYYVHSPNTTVNPGKRFSAFDFSYRIPHLRKWITAYYDSLVVDEVSPILSGRPSMNPGLYFPQIPKVSNLEFRVEGIKTQQGAHPAPNPFPPGFVYTDRRYKNGFTNDGQILGNWIGRAGIGVQSWATYHFSTRNFVELSYRHVNVDHSFLQGGHVNDFSVRNDWTFRPGIGVSTSIQYEHWGFPLLAAQAKSNLTASFQLTFWPTSSAIGRRIFERQATGKTTP